MRTERFAAASALRVLDTLVAALAIQRLKRLYSSRWKA